MAYVGTPIDTQNQFQSLQGKRFSGDGSTTAFTLDIAPSSVFDIEVFVENVRQDPNSAYGISGTTLTFTGAPPSGTNNIYVVHQAKAVGTINPTNDSVTASSIADGAVESEHLNDNIISGQTALGAAPADTDEFLISDAGTIKRVDYSYIKAANTPAFFSIMSANQTISANTATLIDFDNEQLDTDSAYDTTNKRFTVPTGKGGYYFLYAAIGVDDGSTSSQQSLTLYVNGNRQNTTGFATRTFNAVASYGIQTSAIFNLSAGDYIDARARLETTTALYDQLIGDDMRSRFFGYRLIGV